MPSPICRLDLVGSGLRRSGGKAEGSTGGGAAAAGWLRGQLWQGGGGGGGPAAMAAAPLPQHLQEGQNVEQHGRSVQPRPHGCAARPKRVSSVGPRLSPPCW